MPRLMFFLNCSLYYKYFGEIWIYYSEKYSNSKKTHLKVYAITAKIIICSDVAKSILNPFISTHRYRAEVFVRDFVDTFDALNTYYAVLCAFAGSQIENDKAIEVICYFSHGLLQANSANGKNYIKKLSLDRFLNKSDLPRAGEDKELINEAYLHLLEQTLINIYEICNDRGEMSFSRFKARIAENFKKNMNGE
ncbi:MAG: hypothetical protein HUJ51_03220 [Eggerthellaceae bacterium]|nr:hypothetical protein [Eggerthellaceae bacterium]